MFDLMEINLYLIRVEVIDVYYVIELGLDVIMFLGEIVFGVYFLEVVIIMLNINKCVENEFYDNIYYDV